MNRCLIFMFFGVILVFNAFAQKSGEEYSRHFPTENVNKKELNKRAHRPKRKKYSVIYKSVSSGTLYGNPCAVEATKKMGFVYELQPEGVPGSMSEKKTFYHNLGVYIKLTFTRSPFWKLILKKRIKECRLKSGDIVG